MPKMVPLQSVVLFREGKRVRPQIGKVFNFTADEIEELTEASPECLRKPIAETDGDQAADAKEAAVGKAPTKEPAKSAAGGKKGNDEL
ncbi:MAG: hypothetical protein KDG50_07030 [Chromatiales bacterium]|nr:hypothetical protein [Chromatiales bacterium]